MEAVGRKNPSKPSWVGWASGILITPSEDRFPSTGANTTGPVNTVCPRPSRTLTTGAYPLPVRNTLVPSTRRGWFTLTVTASEAPPGVRSTVTSAWKSRALPRWGPDVSNSAVKSSSVRENGVKASASVKGPGVNSSYCRRVLVNEAPSTTITRPSKPNNDPIATPKSSTSKDRWNTRLPTSRRYPFSARTECSSTTTRNLLARRCTAAACKTWARSTVTVARRWSSRRARLVGARGGSARADSHSRAARGRTQPVMETMSSR